MKSMKLVRMLCVLALMVVGFAGSAGAAAAEDCGSRLTCDTEETVRDLLVSAGPVIDSPALGVCTGGIKCDVIVDGGTVAVYVYGQACVPATTNCVSPNVGVGRTGAGPTQSNPVTVGESEPLIREGIICLIGICNPGVAAKSVHGGGTTQTVSFNGGDTTVGIEDSCIDASGCGSSGAAPVQTGIVLTR